ncbi:MAG: OmpA family protein [Muribaculaceae bacterium]
MNRKFAICCCLLWISLTIMAQEKSSGQRFSPIVQGWYVGLQGGVPFGVSTFSSFGADKTRAGFTGGMYGGYRFNSVLSAELSMKWGKTALSAQDCCIEKGYWLGMDGNRYYTSVAGMNGWRYGNLKSSVSLQQYGVQLNVNLLGLFERTKQSRWTLEVSPLLAVVGTKATIKTISENTDVLKGDTKWHLGAGGNLQLGYRITKNLGVGICSGITYLTGSRMDGAPEYRHKNNFVWESGVRIGWTFGKCGKTKAIKQAATTKPIEVTPTVCPEEIGQPAQIETQPDKAETTVSAVETKEEVQLTFPTIYFSFNRTSIAASEQPKLQVLLETLRQHPDVRITITGWCDTKGTKAVNERYSLRRAKAVKNWLVKNGIVAKRIHAKGAGSDYNETNAKKARRAETANNNKEE